MGGAICHWRGIAKMTIREIRAIGESEYEVFLEDLETGNTESTICKIRSESRVPLLETSLFKAPSREVPIDPREFIAAVFAFHEKRVQAQNSTEVDE